MKMKKLIVVTLSALSLFLAFASPAPACGDKANCKCKHADKAAMTQAATQKTEAVSLEGKVVAVACDMMARKMEKVGCTGAALAVGSDLHMIKKAKKGTALVKQAKGTDKVVQVSGQKQGEFLTVETFEIKS